MILPFPFPLPGPAATRGDLLPRDAGGAERRGADPFQAESVSVPALGRRAPGARPGVSFERLAGLAAMGVSAGAMLAAAWLLACALAGFAGVVGAAWWLFG